jgi:hypothetical protein
MRAYYWFVAVVAAFALLGMSAPTLILGLMFTGIGIPLAFLLGAAPALAAVLVPAAILQSTIFRAIPGLRATTDNFAGVLLSVGIALAGNAALSLGARQSGIADLDALAAGDLVPGTPLELQGSVGVVVDGDPYGLGLFECPDLCQRLLLTGIAERVILANADRVPEVPAPDRYATIWRMERRGICPAVSLNTNSASMVIPGVVLRLAADPSVRLLNSRIVSRLSDLGAEAEPVFLDVLSEPPPEGGVDLAYFRHEAWSDQRLWSFAAL